MKKDLIFTEYKKRKSIDIKDMEAIGRESLIHVPDRRLDG